MVGFARKPYLYVLGYDNTNGKDETVLTIGRRDNNGVLTIERVYYGQAAVELYQLLKNMWRIKYGES